MLSPPNMILFCCVEDDFYSRARKGSQKIFDYVFCGYVFCCPSQQPTMLLVELERKKNACYISFNVLYCDNYIIKEWLYKSVPKDACHKYFMSAIYHKNDEHVSLIQKHVASHNLNWLEYEATGSSSILLSLAAIRSM